jgi:hypothetical protein
LRLYFAGLVCLTFAALILFNKATRIAAVVLIAGAAAVILYREELREVVFMHFEDVFLMTTGYLHFQPELGRTLFWLIVGALAFCTVVFMLQKFNFLLLSTMGIIIFTLTWISTFHRDGTAFFVFLFAFILILIRKMNGRVDTAKFAAIPALIIIVVAQMYVPVHSELFGRRTLRDALEGRFTAVEDFLFEFFNPTYFSFAQTGFAGAGGRLGGPVQLNHAFVMEIYAPGMLYLSGATHNYFTGYAWRTTLEPDSIYTHGLRAGHFETLETMAALVAGATFERPFLGMTPAVLRQTFPDEEFYNLQPLDYAVAMFYRERPVVFRLYEGELYGFTPGGGRFPLYVPPGGFPRSQYVVQEPLYDIAFLNVYLPVQTVSIAMGRNRTGTIFRPAGMRQLWFDARAHDYAPLVSTAVTGDMRAPGMMRRGTLYHQEFVHINPNLGLVQELLHASHAGFYTALGAEIYYGLTPRQLEEFIQVREAISLMTLEEITDGFIRHAPVAVGTVVNVGNIDIFERLLAYYASRFFADYAAQVREHFLQVPEITTDRVRSLTHAITANETTDFGRVNAIRDFLVSSYTYTLTPVHVPRNVCFVDHFLFEGFEGYCTYFASAMVIMSRIAGVPARYVEGFFVQGESRHTSRPTVVTNSMAHAWAEVYLEGFGWLVMEATPPYHAAGMEPGFVPGAGFGGGWDGFVWDDYLLDPYWMPDLGTFFQGGGAGAATVPIVDEIEPRALHFYLLIAAAVLPALWLLGSWLVIAMGRLRFARAMSRINKYGHNKQVMIYFKGILDISQYYHLRMLRGETTLAYAKRAGKRFAFRSDSIFLRDLILLYNRARYSPRIITQEDTALMRECYLDMLALLKRMRRRRYSFLRYVKKIGKLPA